MPPTSAVIHRSPERVRQAPVRNFVGDAGSSFGNAAWTLMLKKRIKMERILDMVYVNKLKRELIRVKVQVILLLVDI